ncbi:MAG: elongation factor P [Alphaproteobacteria bacterium]|jgi:elongation factor P|nr:elongation factor P [Alphaproteobacteria bacterium]MDP7191398.1 elongation factor P [Alphaproteobacteria bacterium]HJO89083.1 elongation factor P [Alphaproteobacteria bacterium]
MKIQANTIRPGNVIEYQEHQYTVLKINVFKAGKGGAFIQVEMRDIQSGLKTNERWRTNDSVEKLNVEERACTFLFADGEILTFMDTETYEQITIPRDALGDSVGFLQNGMEVTVDFIEGKSIAVQLPQTVAMTINEADPVVKGQTASSSYKPAVLENGMRIMVPLHIAAGTRVVVNTSDGTYAERAKD